MPTPASTLTPIIPTSSQPPVPTPYGAADVEAADVEPTDKTVQDDQTAKREPGSIDPISSTSTIDSDTRTNGTIGTESNGDAGEGVSDDRIDRNEGSASIAITATSTSIAALVAMALIASQSGV
jgi:hypothetical protein